MKTITKLILSQIIYKKIGGTVNQRLISDIISTVFEYIIDEAVDDRPVSINNFGTFSIRTLKFKNSNVRRILCFKKHMKFAKLWHIKKNRFRKSKKFKKNASLGTFKRKKDLKDS